MKRFAAFLLTLLLVFTLCSCGKKHVEEQTVPPAVEDQTGEQSEVKPAPQPVKPDDTAEDETVVTVPVTPVVKPAEEVKPQGGTSGGGHHGGGGTTVNDLTITEGKNVSGGTYKDVIIAESVGDGTVTLENVTIDGQLIIRGGGSNSVKVKNSKVKEVKLDKDTSTGGEAPRLELTGTEVKTVEVAKPAIIEAKDTASKVETLSAKDDVTIKGEETKVQNVTVPTEAKENVKLTVNDAAVEKVEVNKPVTIETKAAEGKTPVAAVEAKADVTVAGADTKVGTVTVPEAAKNNDVRLQVNNAKVAQVKAEAPVTIETNSAMGETPVEAVEAKANVTVTGAATNVGKVTVDTGSNNGVTLTVTDAKVKNVSAVTPVTIEANEKASKIDKVEAKANVTVASATQIDRVEAKAPVTVDGAKTKIETITVPEKLDTTPEITVTAGSVNTVKADGKAKVSGTAANAITNVEAAAPVEVASAAVAKVTVTVNVNVTVTVSGNGQIEVAVDTNADVNIAADTANNVSVSTTKTVTTNITMTAGEEVQEVHVHKWVESGRTEANCTTSGSISYKCTTCDATKTEIIPAKGHVEVMIPAVEPTCTLSGSTAGKKCAVCNASIVAPRTINALNHDFTGKLISDETGHWHVCAYCGETDTKHTHTYDTQNCEKAASCTVCGYVKKAGTHTWQVSKTTEPTCTAVGSVEYTCASCPAGKTETLAALGHTYGAPTYQWNNNSCTAKRACTRIGCSHEETETVTGVELELTKPTCTEDGVTVYTAAFKNAAFTAQTERVLTDANGHQLSPVEAKSATCAEVGNNAYWVCSECGKVFSDAEGKTATTVAEQMINLLSHTKVHTTAMAATCTENGTKEYWTCSVCHKVFADEDCTIETTVAARALKALGHTFNRGVVDNEYLKSAATCEQAAVYYKSCSCGEKGTETFTSGEVLGHLYGEPTWTWTGYTSAKATFACTRGGCTHTEEVTATGAAITNAVTTSAGCDSTGTRTYTATVTFGGKSYTDTKTETLAVLGHTGVKQNGQTATCEADGWKDYYECSVCHKLFSDSSCQNEIANLAVWKTGSGKLTALGHAYGTPTYEWNDDSCTATRVCTHDDTHKVTETKTGTYVKDTDAACTANEKGHYTVTFNDMQFGSADTEANSYEKPNSARGHSFSAAWSKDDTYHWHTATCEHTTEVSGKAVHGFGDWNNGKHTCTVCDYEETCVHTWNEGVVTTQPTCTEKGVKTYTCSVCGATRTEDVAVVAHTVSKVSGQAATCEENGWTDYYKCSECQKLFSDADCKNEITNLSVWKTGDGKLPALDHAYGTTPTWNWTDYTSATATFTCTRGCGHTETVNATISSKVTTAAGCETPGVRTYTATVSFGGQSYTNTKTVDISATGHTGVKQNGQAATCEENGWNDYYKCSKCQKLFSDENCTSAITDLTAWKNSDGKLPALGHDWAEAWNRDVAGHWHVCTRTGCTVTSTKESHVPGAAATEDTAQTCTACGYELAPATGHLCVNHLTKTDAVAATCTQPGNSAYWSCTCGKYYSDANAEHKIEKDSWILPVIAHTFNQEKAEEDYLKDAATCTAKAVYYKSCTCGAKGTETFEYGNALGHSFTTKASAKKVSDATCTAQAVYKVQCDRCNEVSDTVTVEVGDVNLSNHDYGAPTYSWNGIQCTAERVCTRDANHKETETVDGVYTVQKAATYTENGIAVYVATFENTAFAEQTSETVTLPATPFKVGENTYATFDAALTAAKAAPQHIEDEFFGFAYDVYPTIEIYGNCTLDALKIDTHESIAVKNGGSLTVGTLTMEPGTMNGWWLDAGMLRLERGSSFKLGSVQYTGTNGAFAMGDDKSNIELAGRAPDMGGNNYVAVFNGNITQQNTFTMGSSYMFFNEQKSVLTVKGTLTNNAYVDNRGTIVIDGGTLTNKATIDNESGIIPDAAGSINIKNEGTLTNETDARITGGNIDAFGSTVTNAGTIRVGDNCALIIENGSTLNNTGKIAGGKGSEINIGDYIYADETVTNEITGAPAEYTKRVAAVFDLDQLQDALDTYDYVVPCGPGTGTDIVNTVTLGDLTVPKGKLLILKETVNDGTNRYHNKFVLSSIEIQRDPAEKDPHNGNLVTVGNPNVTVNGRIDAYGFIAFDTLTIANTGYVYVENERMIVDKALTVDQGGTLEIGSGSQMYYRGETDAVINGTLKATVRNVNGFVNQVRSDIQGKGMTPNATMTTLVITQDTILHGEHTVDTVILANDEFEDEEGGTVTRTPTLRVGAGGTLEFKDFYSIGGSTMEQIIDCSENKGEDGYYTVSPVDVIVTEVASATDFLAALDNPTVTDIRITGDITLTYADNLWDHPITKAVTVAKGVTLEVKPYTPVTDGPAEPGMKFNGIMIAANGSLTLEDGLFGGNNATLKTNTYRSGAYEYRSQVNVNGGVLDAKNGALATGSTGNIDFEVGNGELKLPSTVQNYLITYTVDSKEELLSANGVNDPCNNILLKSDVVLTEDYTANKVLTVMNDGKKMYRLTVGSETILTVPKDVTLYVNGEVRVEGTLVNNGTIVGEGFIDVMGGTLNNGGILDLSGDIGVERGATLQNSGSVASNTSFTLADYWYSDGKKETYVLAKGTTLNDLGDKVAVMAVVFSPKQVQDALGDEKYDMVMACGEDDESTVELSNITVPADKALLLKDYVDAGERTIHNAYRLENITFGQDAGIVIMGDPDIYIIGEFDINSVQVDGNPTIYGDGFVHNAEELQEALKNGGDIYLYPFDRDDIKPVIFKYEGGRTEEVYETQYWIDTTAIATNTNLFKMGGEDPMAVFFKNGFTVDEDVTLQLHDLNVVAAANSTVGGRVEAYNGALVVQGENGATLTNNGTIQIGSEKIWGQFAIFDEKAGNKIVNNGIIESYGELKFDRNQNRSPRQFEGKDPIEYATFRDLVCELQQGFGNLPNLIQIDLTPSEEGWVPDLHWVYDYPDGGDQFFNEENPNDSDYDAIEAFSWLIKNEIVPQHSNQNPKLNPWHYMTYNEVSGLFNEFATKVLGTATDLEIATGTDLADKNPCFGKLHEALGGLSRAEVTTEQALRNALNAPYVTEIHVTGSFALTEKLDLNPAGDDQHREVFIDPNFTLTVPQNIQMDIKQNVKLIVVCDDKTNARGQLIVNGNVNVFGELEPNENDRSRITVDREHGGNISYFGNAYFFGERLLEVAGDYMSQKNVIPEGYNQIDGWDNNEQVTCLVAYGLQPENDAYEGKPEGEEVHYWWNFGRTLSYGEMKTVLTNVYRDVYRDALATSSDLPGNVSVGDDQWPEENDILDNRNVEELLGKFALVLPKLNDTDTDSFVIQRTNGEDNTDGKTIIGKTFTNAITVTAVKTNDNFAGELNFVNCTFSGGIKLVYNPDCDYRVNFNDSCTGAVTTDYPEGTTGGDRRIRIAHPNGMTITANALTAFEMNDGCLCSTDSFTVNGLTINGNGCENLEVDVRTDGTTPTIEVTGSENGNAIELSGSYTGKLRVSGCIDVSRVALGTNSWIELANWHDTTNGDSAPNSSIALGGNNISINDDWGEQSFTGSGTIHVNSKMRDLHLTVNERNLANPHVFGNVPNCAVFLGLADVNNVSFSLKQGTWDAVNNCVSSWTDIPKESFDAVYYNESGKVTTENSGPTKTHLEWVEGESGWITDPRHVNLTVTIANGCTVVYDKLWYKDAQVVDQGQTG